MKLSAKHQQQTIIRKDFTGGLNTTSVPELIADNQLAECVNMELNRNTGALQTCCGTAMIYKALSGVSVDRIFYDEINNVYLLVDMKTRKVYQSRLVDMDGTRDYDCMLVGQLSGSREPMAAMWENGLLVASGGRLQYWNGTEFFEITPTEIDGVGREETLDVCNGVFIKDGRVWIWHDYRLVCSGVGDEAMWTDNSNDDSSAKWLDVGYKEGEGEKAYILGVCSLSSDIVILKYDGKIYRLSGSYPDWSLKEIARNIRCLNSSCYVSVQDGVFSVTRAGMFYLATTTNYGDIEPKNVAANIAGLFSFLSSDLSFVRFLPPLNQIWITGTSDTAIIFDLNFNAFYMRKFAEKVSDIAMSKTNALLARGGKVCRLMAGIYRDGEYSAKAAALDWSFQAKSHTSFYDFLVKRIRVAYVPLLDDFDKADIITAQGKIKVPLRDKDDDAPLIFTDATPIYGDDRLLFPLKTQFNTARMIYRDRTFDMSGRGQGAAIILNQIETAITEV